MSKYIFFDNYFLNVDSSITSHCKNFKFCLLGPHTHSEETISQICIYVLVFILCQKNGKHFVKFVNIMFEVT